MQLVTAQSVDPFYPRPAPAAVAQEKSAHRRRVAVHLRADRRAAAGNRLRKRQVPQPHGMLVAEDRHVHDPGQRLHAALRLLLRAQGQDRGTGTRRARARGRSRRPAGPEARRDHLGHARRSARRRRRPFLSMRAGRARANRRGGRSAHARLPRQAGRCRARGRSRARSLQPQHRNRAAAVSRSPRPQKRIPLDARTAAPRQRTQSRRSKPKAA